MKSILLTMLLAGASWCAMGQNPASTNKKVNGVISKSGQNNSSSTDGLNRRGNGQESPKMKDGVSRRGNSNLSPTGPTSVQNGESQQPSRTMSKANDASSHQAHGGVKGAQNAHNNTANDGGMTGNGAKGSAKGTSTTATKRSGSGSN